MSVCVRSGSHGVSLLPHLPRMKVSAASAGLRAAVHAARGGAATLAAATLLANAVKNRNALVYLLLMRWRAAVLALRIEPPSRTLAAASVFVGEFSTVASAGS